VAGRALLRARARLRRDRAARAAALTALVTALAIALATASEPGSESSLRLAGLLPVGDALHAAWPFSGAWLYPIGEPRDFTRGEAPDSLGYHVLRGMRAADGESPGHLGVDLGNGRGGGTVRAASGGLVVRGADDGQEQGYGECVVIAHRLEDGRVVYSVYAHLLEGSVRVNSGQRVWAGRALGRVGRSGRATTQHLHFEIREPGDTNLRWENTPALDPLEFVSARLAPQRPGTDWDARYLDWATLAALIDEAEGGDQPLEQRTWWPMLARLGGIEQPPADHALLADALIARDLLPATARLGRGGPVSWQEVREAAQRLVHRGRLGAIAPRTHRLAGDCRRHLGVSSPRAKSSAIGHGFTAPPTLAQGCLLAAALCAADSAIAASAP
jgi:murein DD-endopeptidase MepM/ murein hydrolase activator NlpD